MSASPFSTVSTRLDHSEAIHYVGKTGADGGFRGRIWGDHTSGDETNSHKFSYAYNTGRMWRRARDGSPDARAAKKLRTLFIREFCRATFVIVSPKPAESALEALEKAVQAEAPEGKLYWVGKKDFERFSEPMLLVDELLKSLSLKEFTLEERAAVERQAVKQAASKTDSP